ncbi:MAG: PAS domain S-box protein [Candidatus Hinthialibacter antarcticus]|nr:PAS domain S-box protein [Candidatus Hinthialibacter antarcticus]
MMSNFPLFSRREIRFLIIYILSSILYCSVVYILWRFFSASISDEMLAIIALPILYSAYHFRRNTFYAVTAISYIGCFLFMQAVFEGLVLHDSLMMLHVGIIVLFVSGLYVNRAIGDLRRYERSLSDERDKLFSILSHTPDRIAVTDEDFNIVFVSQNVEKLYKGCVGKKCYEAFCNRSSPCCVDCSVQEVIQKKRDHFYFSHPFVERNVNGDDSEPAEKMFEFHAYPIQLDGKQCVVEFARDISDRMFAEAELRKSQQKLVEREKIYRDAIELAGCVPYYLNYERDDYDFVGSGIKKLLGYEASEFSRDAWERCEKELFLLDDLKATPALEAVEAVKTGKETHWHAHYRAETRTGEERWLSDSAVQIKNDQGIVIGSIGLLQDITQLISQEKDRILLETAIEQAAESIVITDSAGRIIYVNPYFEQVTGYTRAEALGQNPRVLKSGKHDCGFYEEMWKTLTAGKVWTGVLINKSKTGELFEEEATLSPVVDSYGTIVNYVAVKRDVTEKKQLEQHLRQSQKMEAIGSLAGGIAHDFNNILMATMGYAELVRSQLPQGGELYNQQSNIIKASMRAKELINQILSFSRQTEQEKQSIHLSPILKEALKLLSASIPKNITILSEIESDDICIFGDPTQMHQVMMNLCTNAYHAMRDRGGVLSVTMKCEPAPITQTTERNSTPGEERYCVLKVSDTGVGMDEQTMERVFEPYFTTKKKGDGTGLGLSVVHGIVKDHHGFIDIQSEVGGGTTVTASFPLLPNKAENPQHSEPLLPVGAGETIMIVDDEWPIVEMLKLSLSQLGYRVEGFVSCREALEAFKANPRSYDMVITDMSMPHRSGIEVAQEIAQIREDVPVVLCTGYVGPEHERMIADVEIADVLLKPVLQKDVAKSVHRCLHRPTLH